MISFETFGVLTVIGGSEGVLMRIKIANWKRNIYGRVEGRRSRGGLSLYFCGSSDGLTGGLSGLEMSPNHNSAIFSH